jgi:hypothetical protein
LEAAVRNCGGPRGRLSASSDPLRCVPDWLATISVLELFKNLRFKWKVKQKVITKNIEFKVNKQSERALGAWCLSRPSTGRAPPRPSGAAPACLATWPAERDLQRKPCPQPRLAASPPNLASHSSSSASDRQGQFGKRPPGSVRKPAARGVRTPAVCRRNGTPQLFADGTEPPSCLQCIASSVHIQCSHPVFASSVRIQCSIQCSQFILLEGFGFGSVPVFAVHIVGRLRVRFQCSVPVFATNFIHK